MPSQSAAAVSPACSAAARLIRGDSLRGRARFILHQAARRPRQDSGLSAEGLFADGTCRLMKAPGRFPPCSTKPTRSRSPVSMTGSVLAAWPRCRLRQAPQPAPPRNAGTGRQRPVPRRRRHGEGGVLDRPAPDDAGRHAHRRPHAGAQPVHQHRPRHAGLDHVVRLGPAAGRPDLGASRRPSWPTTCRCIGISARRVRAAGRCV